MLDVTLADLKATGGSTPDARLGDVGVSPGPGDEDVAATVSDSRSKAGCGRGYDFTERTCGSATRNPFIDQDRGDGSSARRLRSG